MIPHHIYEGLYDMDITRDAGRRALGIPARPGWLVLAFGAFRHAEERRLVWGAFRGCTTRPNSCSRRACGPTPGADRGSKG